MYAFMTASIVNDRRAIRTNAYLMTGSTRNTRMLDIEHYFVQVLGFDKGVDAEGHLVRIDEYEPGCTIMGVAAMGDCTQLCALKREDIEKLLIPFDPEGKQEVQGATA